MKYFLKKGKKTIVFEKIQKSNRKVLEKQLTKREKGGIIYGLLKNEVWLSLVERYVREQIADYERKIYKTAETP